MRSYLPWLLTAALLTALPRARAVDATFVQLNRDTALQTVEDWEALFGRMQDAGLNTVIVQWCAEPPLVYFEMENADKVPYFEEVYGVVERVLEAAGRTGISVYLGLQNNPHYWTQINGREKVIRDFFLLRVARNERLQRALLEHFGENPAWVGYYIPDEVDDLTWREEPKQKLVRHYFKLMTERLRVNDAVRPIAASAFFRGRTSPELVADSLLGIFSGCKLDYLLIQDGIGIGDPPISYVSLYYEVIRKRWAAYRQTVEEALASSSPQAQHADAVGTSMDQAVPWTAPGKPAAAAGAAGEKASAQISEETEAPILPPILWGVVESFQQLSGDDEPFAAQPAPAARLREQINLARPFFERLVLFTFPDYMDPVKGEAEKALFELLAPEPPSE